MISGPVSPQVDYAVYEHMMQIDIHNRLIYLEGYQKETTTNAVIRLQAWIPKSGMFDILKTAENIASNCAFILFFLPFTLLRLV